LSFVVVVVVVVVDVDVVVFVVFVVFVVCKEYVLRKDEESCVVFSTVLFALIVIEFKRLLHQQEGGWWR